MVCHRRQISKIALALLCFQLVACNYQLDKQTADDDEPAATEQLPGEEEVLNFRLVQQRVFQPLCQNCHAKRGEFTFENYSVVSTRLEAIGHRVFDLQDMPPSGKMPANEKAILKAWLEEGGPE